MTLIRPTHLDRTAYKDIASVWSRPPPLGCPANLPVKVVTVTGNGSRGCAPEVVFGEA